MANIHASCVVLGHRGVLLLGPSGSGKSTLALSLVDKVLTSHGYAAVVADDRTEITACAGRLVAAPPSPIAGLFEVWGLGPIVHDFERAAVIDICVRLVDADEVQRMDVARTVVIEGVSIAVLDVARRSVTTAAPAILARLAAFEAELIGENDDSGLPSGLGSTR